MTQQQQHIIGLTEFLMIARTDYRTCDPAVQLLKSLDRIKALDEGLEPPDAFTSQR